MGATTSNQRLKDWVDEWAGIFQPDAIEWCDGSDEEYERYCQQLVDAGTFTKLNDIKPEMVAAATKDARAAAEQFAKDSDTSVGGIKQATQGYFEITGRDGDGGGWGVADTPFKRVRVVTTIDFYLR